MAPKGPVHLINNPATERRLYNQTPEVHDERHQTTGDMKIGRAYATPGEANREKHRATGVTVTGRVHATLQEADREKNRMEERGNEMRTGHLDGTRHHEKTGNQESISLETQRGIEDTKRTTTSTGLKNRCLMTKKWHASSPKLGKGRSR